MQLLREHPNESLLCLTVIMPGSVKRNRLSLAVARAATEAIRVEFADSLTQMEERDLETGFEAYVLVSLPTMSFPSRLLVSVRQIRIMPSLMSLGCRAPASPKRQPVLSRKL